ncbi:MAG TPA: sigma-70 family RNA polymerase sigma factor [Planctomycetota bacterium]|nr:sigma-70 family RNA polymerase sigma factor [Planctomycetota bacterium]
MDQDEKSFEILVAEYRGMVHAYCLGIVGDAHLADDLAQETFIVAHRRLADFRPGESFGAWLRGIARNLIREDRRSAARRHVVADSDVVAGMEDVYARLDDKSRGDSWNERLGLVRGCIEALPAVMNQAMALVYGSGLAVAAAAARAGASADTFQRRLSRARDKVRECVETKLRLERVL